MSANHGGHDIQMEAEAGHLVKPETSAPVTSDSIVSRLAELESQKQAKIAELLEEQVTVMDKATARVKEIQGELKALGHKRTRKAPQADGDASSAGGDGQASEG